MITKQMKKQQHMVMTALITIILAVFGSVQNAVGGVTVSETYTWDQATNQSKLTGITLKIDNAGDFAAFMKNPTTTLRTDVSCVAYDGPANADDFAALNDLKYSQLNLSKLTFADTYITADEKFAAINSISNQNVEYLALPDAGAETTDPLFNKLRTSKNPKLIAIVYYYKAKKSYTCYTSKAGEVYILTNMTADVTKLNGKDNANREIDYVKISGNLNAKDISANTSTAKYDKNGHFVLVSDEESKVGGDSHFANSSDGDTYNVAFSSKYNGVITLDLTDAKFEKITDMTLSKTGLIMDNRTTNVLIPTDKSVTELPSDFLNTDNNVIKSICIPYNIQKIGARAFNRLNSLTHVTTTDKDGKLIDFGYDKKYNLKTLTDEAGNSYKDQVLNPDETDTQAGSMAFSANLQEIDSYAFVTVSWVKDVYVLADKAPACHVNAFSSKMYVGNTGYSPNGGITRADYRNSSFWITMLHYPKEIQGHDEEKLYTDVTRDYTITDADGNADGNGNVLKWPNQSEFIRSYQQATNGYLWKAWDAPRTAWSHIGSYDIDLKDASNNQSVTSSFNMTQEEANKWYNECSNKDKSSAIFYHTAVDGGTDVDGGAWQNVTYKNSDEKLYDNDYRGWHQFVLATSFDYKSDTPSHNFSAINDNGWWTICVPFNMTKKEVREMFGYRYEAEATGNPHVCEFTGVLRDAEYTGNPNKELKGKIVLKFDRDVYTNVYNEDGTVARATKDDDIVINAGVPYLLQPDFETRDGSLYYYPAKQVLQDEKCKAVSQVELRTNLKEKVVNQVAVNKNGNKTNYTYTFIGNYWLSEMPKYAYFLAWYDKENVATFFWQTEFPAQTLNWNPYTAIIGCNWNKDDQKIFVPGTEKGNIHWYTRQGNAETGASVFHDDSFSTNGSAKANGPENVSIEAAGNTTDGITKVHFGDRTIDIFHGKVYNLNGQYVGDSLDGLPKGIYIAAGKKYVVK